MIFQPFEKIARLSRKCVVTEKIDGTNAQIHIVHPLAVPFDTGGIADKILYTDRAGFMLLAGSRNGYITPENDNYGFAGWAKRNAEDLMKLGEGRHYGEWWGAGIQRRYGMTEKSFSLFNTHRWDDETKPECCRVVPVLYSGEFDMSAISTSLFSLEVCGSKAAPGFDRPEGIIVYHEAAGVFFKKTIVKDDEPKGKSMELERAA